MTNIFIIDKKEYKGEFIWRQSKDTKTFDDDNNLLSYPTHNDKIWGNAKYFVDKLYTIENKIITSFLEKHAQNLSETQDCLLCNKKKSASADFLLMDIYGKIV